ncbi:MAG TPA: MFS transporter [Gammaproteobacteria bacterium]|nr:MFS transporter [Gammaproteobacteria bacterium]
MRHTSTAGRWRSLFDVYTRRPVITMLFLGFSAGLPFMLVFGTLSAWLRESGVSRTTIGFFSWVGITYSIKVFWAPLIDRLPFPVLTRSLGKRRGWMLAGQLGIASGLIGMASVNPVGHLPFMAGFALLVAFSSATQDVALDAFRIEAEAVEFQGAMAATYQLGWRFGFLASYTGALYLASLTSWHLTYMTMAALTLVGMTTVLITREPEHHTSRDTALREARAVAFVEKRRHWPAWLQRAGGWSMGAVVCPIADFFSRFGTLALAILALVAVFRISDIAMASMANPLYIDLGFTKPQIADISGAYGLAMTILGAFIGGSAVARFGILRPLLVAAVLASGTNLLFAYMSQQHGSVTMLTLVISADNLSGGLAGSVFIAWLSSLTNTTYTATQYALFSSLMTLPGKFLSGFGGTVVDTQGYATFFTATAVLGIPAIALIVFLMNSRGYDRRLGELATGETAEQGGGTG